MKINWFLIWCSAAASVGGLLFGFDTAVIAGTTRALTDTFGLSPTTLGLTVSSALWGTMLGALLAGIPGDRWGRSAALKGLAVLYLVSALGCAFSWDFWSLVTSRFVGGLAIGGSSVLGPMYIAEIAPAQHRGKLVALFQFNIVSGILVAYLSNFLVGQFFPGANEWRIKLGAPAIPSVIFGAMLFTVAQSPRWLARMKRLREAREVLRRFGVDDPDRQLREILDDLEEERTAAAEKLFTRSHRFPVFLAVSVAFFSQLTGINAILYYLNDIFERSGFSKVSSEGQAVIVGAAMMAATVIAMLVIDRLGRRMLLLVGSVGTALCLGGVAWIFSSGAHQSWLLWLLVAYIVFFAFSQGSVIWVYISEVFPNRVRAKGQSLGCFTHWLTDAIVAGTYPLIASHWQAAPFAFFASMMVLQFFLVFFIYPETKGISLEQMHRKLAPGPS